MPLGDLLGPVLGPILRGKSGASTNPVDANSRGGEPSASDASAASSGPAAYVRPKPAPPAPRMVMDDPGEVLSLDWARRAAQAVVSQISFMDWVERPKPSDPSAPGSVAQWGGESRGTDYGTALRAYGEFSEDEGPAALAPAKPASQAAAGTPQLVIMRGPEERA